MTDFEQKLASMRPRQLREIELPEKTTRTTSRDHRSRKRSRAKRVMPYIAGFLAGVIVTYLTMTHCPVHSPTETPAIGTGTVVVTPILDDAAIDTLRRPMDLRQLASVRIVKEQSVAPLPETEFQYRTLLLKEIERQRR